MTVLKYPYACKPRAVTNYAFPLYPIQIAESDSFVEVRSLLSEIPAKAFIELSYSWQDCRSVEKLLEFYTATRGHWSNFTIPDDHTLWSFIPGSKVYRAYLPDTLWRLQADQIVLQPAGKWGKFASFNVKLINLIGESA